MEIQEIKSRLKIIDVAKALNIKIGKDHKALCPFHNDKTPSLQFSLEKNICTCFSSKCNAGTMDIIGLTEKSLEANKHEALVWLTNLAGSPVKIATKEKTDMASMNYQEAFEQMQSSFISSSTARKYAESRELNRKKLEIGYNAFKEGRFNYLRGCIIFGLRDRQGNIVSMYGRSIRDADKSKHYYIPNRKGLYPNYPNKETVKLILTESIIDAATLLQNDEITKDYQILALYGTNGLTTEHANAIQQLESLNEIILFFDGDEAGKSAIEKQGKYLKELFPEVKISTVETPEGEDINSLAITHEPEVFAHLINNRKPFSFQLKLSDEISSIEKKKDQALTIAKPSQNVNLITTNPYKITYTTQLANYHVKGGISKILDNMKVTLEIENMETSRKSRTKPDLYEDKQVEKVSREAAEKLGLRADLIEYDLSTLTDLLDKYRENEIKKNEPDKNDKRIIVQLAEQHKCVNFLKQKELINKFNQQIQKAGITGEENNRIFLFVIATAYKMPETLHALIQGSSGSGKTYLSRQITDLMPKEDVIRLTRVTESSFYNYGEYELRHKLIVLEDIDGLKEEAEYAFRELQSNNEIISSTSIKDENNGNIKAQIRKVKGPIGSIATTTKGELYEDNMSRIFLLAVDESRSQTDLIINYQNQKAAGMINKTQEIETKQFIQNCIRMLKPYEVINPFANKILLPQEAHKIRRLTELFHSFMNQITLLNQYQRKKDNQGRLITEKEDVLIAIDIMFDSIILKIDELDGSLRQFYERLKQYIQKQGNEYKNYQFTQREIRHALNVSKSQLHYYINDLIELEYLSISGGYANRGYNYKIAYWDSLQALRDRIKKFLYDQLKNL